MPDFIIEREFEGAVCGIDEAGRGPLAGPVVASAVIYTSYDISADLLNLIDDSKKLSISQRETAYKELCASNKLIYAIGIASVAEIDKYNILQATFMAMDRAARALSLIPNMSLIDGNKLPKHFISPTKYVIKGDAKSISIASASIIAKVYRDEIMLALSKEHPEYNWDNNAGYGTKKHLEAISKYGITKHHRKTFAPIKHMLASDGIKNDEGRLL